LSLRAAFALFSTFYIYLPEPLLINKAKLLSSLSLFWRRRQHVPQNTL